VRNEQRVTLLKLVEEADDGITVGHGIVARDRRLWCRF
jgi:hypothetical protein